MKDVNLADVERDFVVPGCTARDSSSGPMTDFLPQRSARPLPCAQVAFVATSGMHLVDQQPFDITVASPGRSAAFLTGPQRCWLPDTFLVIDITDDARIGAYRWCSELHAGGRNHRQSGSGTCLEARRSGSRRSSTTANRSASAARDSESGCVGGRRHNGQALADPSDAQDCLF